MNTKPLGAVILCLILLLPGCTSITGDVKDEDLEVNNEIINCQDDPSQSGCLVKISPNDCSLSEIFDTDSCREINSPKNLQMGVSELILEINSEMQPLTPSFLGDRPSSWSISPNLPEGIIMDLDSGVISGIPIVESISKNYTVTATNFAGSTSFNFSIRITSKQPVSISYSPSILECTVNNTCSNNITIEGGIPTFYSIIPELPYGLYLLQSGEIQGIPQNSGNSNHTIIASNSGGYISKNITISISDEKIFNIEYNFTEQSLVIGQAIEINPQIIGPNPNTWISEPDLPEGLIISEKGKIIGIPTKIQNFITYNIQGSNGAGTVSTNISFEIIDIGTKNLSYGNSQFSFMINEDVQPIIPYWDGGNPTSWEINNNLPIGLFFDDETGIIFGKPSLQSNTKYFTIWANNSGGSTYFQFSLEVIEYTISISWPLDEIAIASNNSFLMRSNFSAPNGSTWEISPSLPNGLSLFDNGTIIGTPIERSDWDEYFIWVNFSGFSANSSFWLAVHDLIADQSEIIRGMEVTNWNGLPSTILPVGKWSFPVGISSRDDGKIGNPVISASHVGRGKMLGYGHESWISGGHTTQELTFSLQAVQWVCGKEAEIGISYGSGLSHYKEDLENDGHNVQESISLDDLSEVDCLIDEFWNGHDARDNSLIEDFLVSGGGLIMGGHSWYWSYSNSDLSNSFPGNKIAKTTGLFVSNTIGGNIIDMSSIPHSLNSPKLAINALTNHILDIQELTEEESKIADSTISLCTDVISLDFNKFWNPLRELVNLSGWTVIEYGSLYEDVGHNFGADPVADSLIRIESALTLKLPAEELIPHPSHEQFPGKVPDNATRISRTIIVDGNQSGLDSNFGYSNPRADIRISTGLYAAAGEIVTISVQPDIVTSGTKVLIGAHTDTLWNKDQIHRHPVISRWWEIDNISTEVGNAFGGQIYITIPAGSTIGNFSVNIDNAVKSPTFILGQTDMFQWLNQYRYHPAPWAEIGSDLFILTVPSHEIRNLENPDELMHWWNQALSMEHELYGFLPWPRIERAVFDAQISVGWMHSGYPFMAHDLSVPDVVNFTYMSENGDWGMFHELGHNHQWMPSTLPGTVETGCNFASVYLMEELVGISGHGALEINNRKARTREYFDDGSNISNWSVWVALETFLIIKENWGWTPITEALKVYYDLPEEQIPSNDIEEYNAWVIHISTKSGFNLAPYHQAWGFPIIQSTFDELSHLPVWVDDPLRSTYFEYDSILRNLSSPIISSPNSATVNWETYDNGTNISLTIFYGENDGGNNQLAWENSQFIGSTNVGNHSTTLTGLDCCGTTYYARIHSSNGNSEKWYGPISWTTDYLPD